MAKDKLSDHIRINDRDETAIIFGHRISKESLKTLFSSTPPGLWFRFDYDATVGKLVVAIKKDKK